MIKQEIRTRRLAWEIMKKAAFRDRRLSDVTAEIFRREGNIINDQERRFVTMLVQGTVRLSGRLDWELRQVFVGDYKDLKENLRILLRLGVFQLYYMDSIPDYAAVTTTVQLAKKIHNNQNIFPSSFKDNSLDIWLKSNSITEVNKKWPSKKAPLSFNKLNISSFI